MFFKIYKAFLLVFFFSLCSFDAFAQCEDDGAAIRTATAMKAENSSNTARQKATLAEIFGALDIKAEQLGWTKIQKIAFLKNMQEKGKYLFLTLQIQQQVLAVMLVKNELASEDVKNDAARACTIGLKFGPLERKILELNEELFEYMRQEISQAK